MSDTERPPIGDFIYLQPLEASEAHRLLVRRSSFDRPPHASWFYLKFVKLYDNMHAEELGVVDGVFVYHVPVRHALLLELVQCASNMEYARMAMQRVPKSVVDVVDTNMWAALMDEYCVTILERDRLPDGPPRKKARRMLPAWFPTPDMLRAVIDSHSVVTHDSAWPISQLCAVLIAGMNPIARRRAQGLKLHMRASRFEPGDFCDMLRDDGYDVRRLPDTDVMELRWNAPPAATTAQPPDQRDAQDLTHE